MHKKSSQRNQAKVCPRNQVKEIKPKKPSQSMPKKSTQRNQAKVCPRNQPKEIKPKFAKEIKSKYA